MRCIRTPISTTNMSRCRPRRASLCLGGSWPANGTYETRYGSLVALPAADVSRYSASNQVVGQIRSRDRLGFIRLRRADTPTAIG
jgi:hypothetical protein